MPDATGAGGSERPIEKSSVDNEGASLCQKLRALPSGQSHWREYERLGESILKYLFHHDLVGWSSQNETDDGLNRFDIICRIHSTNEYWRFLQQHLDSRYILFEFKNHTEEIGQGEILTTEKYLLSRGLRRAAIVMCRQGANVSAKRMAQGAMREHGKLIIVLDDKQVCRMLDMKQRGEDPADYLFDITDEFLQRLPR